jgi:hypothetical protein
VKTNAMRPGHGRDASRLHAVRFFQPSSASGRKTSEIQTLVAFSGEVNDPTQERHTEHSLNKLPPKHSIEDA